MLTGANPHNKMPTIKPLFPLFINAMRRWVLTEGQGSIALCSLRGSWGNFCPCRARQGQKRTFPCVWDDV